jgi:hypothetical protein
MWKLGETFIVRDVMVQLSQIEYVLPGDDSAARSIVSKKGFSVVPISEDGKRFTSVFWTEHEPDGTQMMVQDTSISDHIPDSTPIAEAFFLFEAREWYLTLRENRVSGLITYWAFNSREFRVQMYAALSRLEELSRDVLAKDGCGISSEKGLNLSAAAVEKIRVRFETAKSKLGGNRFVDELDFHQVNDALRKHSPWRNFLHDRLGSPVSNTEYERRYSFTGLRDAVMHGRIVFPTYQDFRKQVPCIANIVELIDHLDAYLASGAAELQSN